MNPAGFSITGEGARLTQSSRKMFIHHVPDVSTKIGEDHTPGAQVLRLSRLLRLLTPLLFSSVLLLVSLELRSRTGLRRCVLLILTTVRGKLLRILHPAVGTELLLLLMLLLLMMMIICRFIRRSCR